MILDTKECVRCFVMPQGALAVSIAVVMACENGTFGIAQEHNSMWEVIHKLPFSALVFSILIVLLQSGVFTGLGIRIEQQKQTSKTAMKRKV